MLPSRQAPPPFQVHWYSFLCASSPVRHDALVVAFAFGVEDEVMASGCVLMSFDWSVSLLISRYPEFAGLGTSYAAPA